MLFAWATPIQVPIQEGNTDWGAVYFSKVQELEGTDPEIESTALTEIGGRPVARVDAKFQFGKGGPTGALRGATLEVAGQNMHIATVGSRRFRTIIERQLVELVERLDFHVEPREVEFGGTVEAKGITTVLPDDWRPPLESEVGELASTIAKIGVEDLEPCWTALRPRAAGAPDVMVTCQGGLLLGVVDEHSFAAVDPVVREKMFGSGVEIAPAEQVVLSDRVGFAYAPREGLAVGVVPYDQGVARTWVVGEGELMPSLTASLQGSSYSGPHPASLVDQVSYWLLRRTTSPVVLCPLGGCLCVGLALGLGVVTLSMRRSRNKYAAFDPD